VNSRNVCFQTKCHKQISATATRGQAQARRGRAPVFFVFVFVFCFLLLFSPTEIRSKHLLACTLFLFVTHSLSLVRTDGVHEIMIKSERHYGASVCGRAVLIDSQRAAQLICDAMSFRKSNVTGHEHLSSNKICPTSKKKRGSSPELQTLFAHQPDQLSGQRKGKAVWGEQAYLWPPSLHSSARLFP
jgi:hypothetical protein